MKKIMLCLFAIVLCLASTSLYANTIFSENFEGIPSNQTGLSLTSAGQFHTINGTNIDVVSAANGWAGLVVAPESGNVVDLGGTGGNPLGQLQSIAINLGPGSYFLSFDLVGSQRGLTTTTNVALGPSGGPNLYDQTFTLGSSDDVSGIVSNAPFTVTSPETVYLTFSLLRTDNGNIGSLLDNVSITTASTPEPSSLLLLVSGLAGFGAVVRRKISR